MLISNRKVIYLGVDVQKAFGKNAQSPKLGQLALGEDQQVENNAALATAVYDAGGTVIVTKDWHNPVNTPLEVQGGTWIDRRAADEFEQYGIHATPASGDADLNVVLETTLQQLERRDGHQRRVIPVDLYESSPSGDSERIIEVHKNVYDVTKREVLQDGVVKGPIVENSAFLNLLREQAAEQPVTVVLGGKIAEVCVRAGGLSLMAAIPGLHLVVPQDAVSSLPPGVAHKLGLPNKQEVLQEFKQNGIEVVTTTRELLDDLAS